ncbi:ATPase family associated with various cellular activities (AAA) [Lishizhenia tianjinensis]|uniref:ATPase family associated with various cellular activities (AAA) n=1 Tax=Lishizhenia tianjinensis TaxID=477690 RepID=A0A1I6YJW1_9FLAO|nr:DNA repair ATPase [Lishizhenia tianjinensis]SFT50617.1 ATPase family associated with various cellular activities (AAA) [Lishizhenia tianjinensis]
MNNEEQTNLDGGTYEIIRSRLNKQGEELAQRLEHLNTDRKAVFGAIENKLLSADKISTDNNCIARDMVSLGGNRMLFGFNVHIGLREEVKIEDVFAFYHFDDEKHNFRRDTLALLEDEKFFEDFANLYKYYKETTFVQFAEINGFLYFVFQTGKNISDIKTFKWKITPDCLVYYGNRSDSEYKFPNRYEFKWKKAKRDMQRKGTHGHISLEDLVFVETTGGDLTVKVEDNTDTGKGIYAEPVDQADQTLDDVDLQYAVIGNLVVMKIKPYKEEKYRYLVYNVKIQEVVRIDAIEDACVLLPDDHGIIFPKGYYLQTGEFKLFDNPLDGMLFERKINSPNGEDFMYVFYNQQSGIYILLSYNLIAQSVLTPIICNGFSLFENGELVYFRAEEEQQKHHSVQVWQTPFLDVNVQQNTGNDSYLAKLGNKTIVRTMAECKELIKLLNKEDSFGGLYVDITKKTQDILDTQHWLMHEEAHKIGEPIDQIRQTASKAIDEFEKVRSIKQQTAQSIAETSHKAQEILKNSKYFRGKTITSYVDNLAELRGIKGQVVALKDLRYANLAEIEALEADITQQTEELSKNCISFLIRPEALDVYEEKVEEINGEISGLTKSFDAKNLEDKIISTAKKLEMLIEIVGNLRIEDVTKSTQIIDQISAVYAKFNTCSASLKNKKKELLLVEGKAEFAAQLTLISQSVVNFLDLSSTEEKADEYMNKLMVQLEELESKFVDFDEFVDQVGEKRESIYEAFENRKIYLQEQRGRRTTKLEEGAKRLLKTVENKLKTFKEEAEIQAYYASDLMVEKVRNTVDDLIELGDTVKADDVAAQLKSLKENALRSLKDKKELFANGDDVIQFGNHQFLTNKQKLGLTLIQRGEAMFYHITGTNFFKEVEDEVLNGHKAIWNSSLISENDKVYRGAYLAYLMFKNFGTAELVKLTEEELLEKVRTFMSPRYKENYIKGVHDADALLYLQAFIKQGELNPNIFVNQEVRALARVAWMSMKADFKGELEALIQVNRLVNEVLDTHTFTQVEDELFALLSDILPKKYLSLTKDVAAYLTQELLYDDHFVISSKAYEDYGHLVKKRKSLILDNVEQDKLFHYYQMLQNALENLGYNHAAELSSLMLSKNIGEENVIPVPTIEIDGLKGDHSTIVGGKAQVNLADLFPQIENFIAVYQRDFESLQHRKKELVDTYSKELRLNELEPKVMNSFVRNQLINEVYLPIVGDNLAKQIGAVGANKRTDLMGMLLLVSPPGYGKTTLMEYIANRLGLIFMKINGPSIGHEVTSLDPKQADSTAAAQELRKLNLAFEMGDNVMIYLDDIQHCSPVFLQKFISLADGQRKIEGVFEGQPKTYDFRGKKVAVIMAGNPYTESGGKFQIPDMLANRADIYNLGDIVGGHGNAFASSFIENSLSSHPLLNQIKNNVYEDVKQFVSLAEGKDKELVEFKGQYSAQVVEENVSLFEKMIKVRDVVMKVNELYIQSANQDEVYRREPAFKLQGSYRNMNKIVEKLNTLMNEEELLTLLQSHYENESQTLTADAEANLLKFKSTFGWLNEQEAERWEEIVREFQKRQKTKGYGDDSSAQMMVQLQEIAENLKALAPDKTEALDGFIYTLHQGMDRIAQNLREHMDKE